jgi:hypothetical protein
MSALSGAVRESARQVESVAITGEARPICTTMLTEMRYSRSQRSSVARLGEA